MNIPVSSRSLTEKKKAVFQLTIYRDGLSVCVSVSNRLESGISQLASMVIRVSDPTTMPHYSDIRRAVVDLFSPEEFADVDPA